MGIGGTTHEICDEPASFIIACPACPLLPRPLCATAAMVLSSAEVAARCPLCARALNDQIEPISE